VKRTRILVCVLAVLVLLTTSCGTSDKIASVSITAAGQTGVTNLAGLGGTLQLQVLANYTSGKQIDETNFSSYTITPEGTYYNGAANVSLPTPPYGLSLNGTGMVTATADQGGYGICTWENLAPSGSSTPSWFYTGDYTIVATYRGFTSNPIYIPVASAADLINGQVGDCGPSSSGQ